MAFGYEVSRPNGSIMTNGLTRGGVLVDVLTCPAGNSSSKSYPRTHKAGLTYYFARAGAHQITLVDQVGSDGSVQGTVKWDWTVNGWQQDTVLYVFAKQLDSLDLFGIQLTNDAGEVFADPNYPAPQFAGTVQLGAAASLSYATPGGYTANVHQATVNLRAGADKMVLMCLPDVGANDTWYHLRKEFILGTDGSTIVEVVVYTKAASYTLPSLHVYAVNLPLSSAALFTVEVSTPAHQITYDAAVEGFSSVNELQMQYAGTTTTYSLPAGYTLGMSVPFYKRSAKTVNGNGSRFDETVDVGVGKRVGTQLTLNILRDTFRTVTTSSMATYTVGGTQLRYSPVADVSQLTPSNIAGTPAAMSVYPTITTDLPAVDYKAPGQQETYSIGATGTNLTYQWYKKGVMMPGKVTNSISFTAQNANDGDTYYCVVTNELGSATSVTSTFYIDTSTPPYLVSASGGGTYHAGATVNVSVQGGGNPTPTARLYHGGKVAEGTPTANYSFTMPALPYGSDTGYVVSYEISNQGEHIGNVVTGQINFQSYEYSDFTPVSVSSNPQTQTVNAGDTVTMSATFSGSLPMRTICYRNGQQYASSSSVTFTASAADNGSTWSFHASNGNGTTDFADGQFTANSSTATLTVRAPVAPTTPVFDLQPSDQYITSGQNASFSCHAAPANRYQWYQNNAQMSGQTSSSIFLPARDTGWNLVEFYCVAFNDAANGTAQNSSSTAVLHVAPATAPTTYTAYVNGSPYVDSETGTVSWSAGGDSTDSGAWHNNSPGDNSLYDVQALSGSGASEGAALNTWYSMSGGASWYITANSVTRTKRLSFTYQIRLRSTGSIVSSGSVSLTSTFGVAG